MSVRTVYRDLQRASTSELGVPVWAEGGLLGHRGGQGLPAAAQADPVRGDGRRPVGPADGPLRRQVRPRPRRGVREARRRPARRRSPSTSSGRSTSCRRRPATRRSTDHVRLLTQAWAERRVVTHRLRAGPLRRPARRRARATRPAVPHRAVAPDARALPDRASTRSAARSGRSRSSGSRTPPLTPRTFEPPDPAGTTAALRRAWDIIADQEPIEVVLRFTPAVAARVLETTLAPDPDASEPGPTARSSGGRRVAGHDRDPALDPVVGRRRRGPRAGRAAGRRGRHARPAPRPATAGGRPRDAPPVRRGQPHQRPDPRLRRADQAARPATSRRAAGLPDEDVAEEDLLDTAWLQRLRRISQLQSARWVFPTAEHSRFTHGLGVMHEAGLWARSLYPSLRGDAGRAPASPSRPKGLVVETLRMAGLLHDVGHGPFAHFFDDHVLAGLPGPGRPAPARRQAPDPRGPVGPDHRARARARSCAACGGRPAPSPSATRSPTARRSTRAGSSFLISKPALADAAMPRWVRWLQPLLSGVFTVDNLDYVRRDAYLTGVSVGPVDVERLRRYTFISERGLTLYEPGLGALEMFLTARLFMYQQVYFHRTVRAIDLDLAEVFGPSIRAIFGDGSPADGWPPTPTSTSTRCSTRPPAGRAARRVAERARRPATGRVTPAVADGLAGDPAAPAARGAPRRRSAPSTRRAPGPRRSSRRSARPSPGASRSTSPRSTPDRPTRPSADALLAIETRDGRRPSVSRGAARRSRRTGSSPGAIGGSTAHSADPRRSGSAAQPAISGDGVGGRLRVRIGARRRLRRLRPRGQDAAAGRSARSRSGAASSAWRRPASIANEAGSAD